MVSPSSAATTRLMRMATNAACLALLGCAAPNSLDVLHGRASERQLQEEAD